MGVPTQIILNQKRNIATLPVYRKMAMLSYINKKSPDTFGGFVF